MRRRKAPYGYRACATLLEQGASCHGRSLPLNAVRRGVSRVVRSCSAEPHSPVPRTRKPGHDTVLKHGL